MCNYEQNRRSGFSTCYRSMLDWEWYTDIPCKTLFLHCLLKANVKDNNWKGIEIKRGQFITSLEHLAIESGLTISQVRTALKKLNKTGELTSKGHGKYTIITVTNYSIYQDVSKQITTSQQTDSNEITTTKPINQYNQLTNNSIPTKTKKVFVPPTLEEVKKYCIERNNNVDAATWFDFYQSKDWLIGKNKMKDWKASVRTWERSRSPVATKPAPSYRYETNNQIKWG